MFIKGILASGPAVKTGFKFCNIQFEKDKVVLEKRGVAPGPLLEVSVNFIIKVKLASTLALEVKTNLLLVIIFQEVLETPIAGEIRVFKDSGILK